MSHWLPSLAYRSSDTGYWSPVTSTINWCEEDYYATTYCAEIINTLTNLAFAYITYVGIANCIRERHDRVFIVIFLGYFAVGLGSFCFHTTLKYPWQLVDELSMIYTMSLTSYSTYSYGKSPAFQFALGSTLAILAASATAFYHYLKEPVFHQTFFGLVMVSVLGRGFYDIETMIRRHPKDSSSTTTEKSMRGDTPADVERARQVRQDDKIVRQCELLYFSSMGLFLLAFVIWNLDNYLCSDLQRMRHEIGLPWGILLEGHAWWHLGTCLSAHFGITWGMWLQHCRQGRQDDFELRRAGVLSLPMLYRIKKVRHTGANVTKRD